MAPFLMINFDQILKAYRKCAKGKRHSGDCNRFEYALGAELVQLWREINERSYKPSPARCFVVDHPKVREIWAAPFRDRIVHHLIVEPLEEIWEPSFHPKSFACRKEKGLHAAIDDLSKQVRRISRGGHRPVWALQVDIESFFFTIDRQILRELFLRKARDPDLIWLIENLFSHDPRENFKFTGNIKVREILPRHKSWLSRSQTQGIPIGNLTSQFGANLYLNDLDHFVTRKIKPMAYLRYMDDLLLLHDDPNWFTDVANKIDNWLQMERCQKLNPAKTTLNRLFTGIDYLGFHLRQSPELGLIVLPSQKKLWDTVCEVRRLERLDWWPERADFPFEFWNRANRRQELSSLNSRLGLIKHTKSFNIRRRICKKLKATTYQREMLLASELCRPLGAPLKVSSDFSAVRLNR